MSENPGDARTVQHHQAEDASVIGWLIAAARADVATATSEDLREQGPEAAKRGLSEVVALIETAVGPGWAPGGRYADELDRLGFVWEQRTGPAVPAAA